MQHAKLGRTGNQALRDTRMQAMKEGLVPSIYCHPSATTATPPARRSA